MKHLLMGCIALCISFGAIAQPSPLDFCPDTSSWNGIGEPTQDSRVLLGDICPEPEASPGYYLYWNEEGPFTYIIDPVTASTWADAEIYGIKGHQGIGVVDLPAPIRATVFETHLQTDPDLLQSPQFPEFEFRTGWFEFKVVLVDDGTTIVIKDGATLEVSEALILKAGSTIEVEPGGKLLLSRNDNIDRPAIIDNRGGTIEGKVSRKVQFSFPNTEALDADPEESALSFSLSTSLKNVNMHQVMSDLQDSLGLEYLDGTYDVPHLQASTWGQVDELTENVPYLANHLYMNTVSWADFNDNFDDGYLDVSFSEDFENAASSYQYWGGIAPLDGEGLLTLETGEGSALDDIYKRLPVVGHYGLHKHYGVGSLPIYTTGGRTITDLVANNPQVISLANGATGGSEEYQNDLATIDDPMMWIFKAYNFPDLDELPDAITFEIEGEYEYSSTIPLTSESVLIQDNKDHGNVTTGYQDTLYAIYMEQGVNTPVSFWTDPDTYFPVLDLNVEDVDVVDREGTEQFFFADYTGLNVIQNTFETELSLESLAQAIQAEFPYTSLAFYNIDNLPSHYEQRDIELGNNSYYSEQRYMTLPIVSQYMTLPVGEPATSSEFFDLYSIELPYDVWNHGPTLFPNQALGFNLVDPVKGNRYEEAEYAVPIDDMVVEYNYTNMSAQEQSYAFVNGPDYQYAGSVLENTETHEDLMNISASGQYLALHENSYDLEDNAMTLEELSDLNSMSLLALIAEMPNGDEIIVGMIPLRYSAEYTSEQANPFVSQMGVNPGFYIINGENAPNPAYRTVTDYYKGAHVHGLSETPKPVHVVVRPEALTVNDYDALRIEVLMNQGFDSNWPYPWRWTISEDVYGQPDFALNNLEQEWSIEVETDEYDHSTLFPNDTVTEVTYEDVGVYTLYPTPFFGDFNGDGVVSMSDFLIFLGYYGQSEGDDDYEGQFDYNGDGIIGAADMIGFLQFLGSEWNTDGPELPETDIQKRAEALMVLRKVERTHSPYNIFTDYAWPDAPTRVAFQEVLTDPGMQPVITVIDETGLVMHRQAFNGGVITLPNAVPSSAELVALSNQAREDAFAAGGLNGTGYRIIIQHHYEFPVGDDDPRSFYCLGCSSNKMIAYPDHTTTALPEFD